MGRNLFGKQIIMCYKKRLFLLFCLFFEFFIFSQANQTNNQKKNKQTLTLEELSEETNLEEEILEEILTEEIISESKMNSPFEFSDSETSEKKSLQQKNDILQKNQQNLNNEIQTTTEIQKNQKYDEKNNDADKNIENQQNFRKEFDFITEEILNRPEVEKFRRQYLNEKWLKHLYSVLENSMEYRLYVRKAIQDRNLPEILEYLPVVESNYKTNAKSRSGAIGMWQFMENSVYPFLVLDDFVDERLDPWKSTDAALRKLTENYDFFKDWYIAVAAYNCGVGAMNKILAKAEKKDFWELVDSNLLPKQTADYVPKLIAIADLAINSEYYNINLPKHQEEFNTLINEKNGNFDYITTEKSYSLRQLAQEMRIDYAALKKLNPSYIHDITYPVKKSEIRLPLGMKKLAENALEKLLPIEFPLKYTVVKGDSLWSISGKFNVSIQSICDLNEILENDILRIGKILYIPAK